VGAAQPQFRWECPQGQSRPGTPCLTRTRHRVGYLIAREEGGWRSLWRFYDGLNVLSLDAALTRESELSWFDWLDAWRG
jgi:hypothetical protein